MSAAILKKIYIDNIHMHTIINLYLYIVDLVTMSCHYNRFLCTFFFENNESIQIRNKITE